MSQIPPTRKAAFLAWCIYVIVCVVPVVHWLGVPEFGPILLTDFRNTQLEDNQWRLSVRVLHADSDQPVAGATVSIASAWQSYSLGSGTCDEDGIANLLADFPQGASASLFYWVQATNNDRWHRIQRDLTDVSSEAIQALPDARVLGYREEAREASIRKLALKVSWIAVGLGFFSGLSLCRQVASWRVMGIPTEAALKKRRLAALPLCGSMLIFGSICPPAWAVGLALALIPLIAVGFFMTRGPESRLLCLVLTAHIVSTALLAATAVLIPRVWWISGSDLPIDCVAMVFFGGLAVLYLGAAELATYLASKKRLAKLAKEVDQQLA